MEDKKTGLLIVLVSSVLLFAFGGKKKTTGNGGNTGNGGGGTGGSTGGGATGTTATITDEKAAQLATRIKNAIGYIITDWNEISTVFFNLKNDKDVEKLYTAFGTWDGPANKNGDLITVLNICYSYDQYTVAIIQKPRLEDRKSVV